MAGTICHICKAHTEHGSVTECLVWHREQLRLHAEVMRELRRVCDDDVLTAMREGGLRHVADEIRDWKRGVYTDRPHEVKEKIRSLERKRLKIGILSQALGVAKRGAKIVAGED